MKYKYFTFKSWLKHYKHIKKLKKIIEFYRKNPADVAEQLLGIKLHWYQKFMFNNLVFYSKIYISSRNKYKDDYKQIMKIATRRI